MGCSNVSTAQTPCKVPIAYEALNEYVDKFPMLVIIRLKEKFDAYCQQKTGGQKLVDFKNFYAQLQFNDQLINNLYEFFTDNKRQVLKFKQFMFKYATILKCDDQILAKIIYELYKNKSNSEKMSAQDFQNFIEIQKDYFALNPKLREHQNQFILKDQLYKLLVEAGFYWKDYRNRFNIIQKNDIPFEAINKQLLENQINDLEINDYYYVLSTSWFERWAYYFQGENYTMDQFTHKSTKLMPKDKKSLQKISVLKRNSSRHNVNSSQNNFQDQTVLIQQPTKIEFQDIQGQYFGELKQGLRPFIECKYITERLWKMMIKIHQPTQVFRRKAISHDNLQLYPKTVYCFQTKADGKIIFGSLQTQQIGIRSELFSLSTKTGVSFFIKNFEDKNWIQQAGDKMLAECSISGLRFFVAITQNKEQFIKKNTRVSIASDNLTVGDLVFANFPYQKRICEAYIMNIIEEKALIHYKGYSYKYQTMVPLKQLSTQEEQLKITLSTQRPVQIFKGLSNIGNTCFINSNIQCLLSTPVLQDYLLQNHHFTKSKSPILVNVIQVASSLLKNENALAQPLKKAIDINLPTFSGHDQHDAQQFLSLLLDKMNQEHEKKPTIIQQLFGGKIMSTLTCLSCHNKNEIHEQFYTLSLPIPEPKNIYFTIIMVPIYQAVLKKVVFKLKKTDTVLNYKQAFQLRINKQANKFIFAQMISGVLKKVRTDISNVHNDDKKVLDIGLNENSQIYAFQLLNSDCYNDILTMKRKNRQQQQFYDFYHQNSKSWHIVRICEKRKEAMKIQILDNDNQIENLKITKAQAKNLAPLGSKVYEVYFRKIYHRKYNSTLLKYQTFGLQMLITIPKWATYNDFVVILDNFLQNVKQNAKLNKSGKNQNMIIRLIESPKGLCVFCGKQLDQLSSGSNTKVCCSVLEKDIPLAWIIKKKSYLIYVDWITNDAFNPLFFSRLSIDNQSKLVQEQKKDEKINLSTCLDQFKAPEKVQMQCDKCKKDQQFLEATISSVPNILVLHMKQFRYTSQGHLIKLHIKLQWQQFLDISNYTLNKKGNIYELYAFIMHEGSGTAGHYTCTAKRKHPAKGNRVWVNFDDDYTTIMKEEAKNIDNAYLLFFKKVDMPTSAYVHYTDIMTYSV